MAGIFGNAKEITVELVGGPFDGERDTILIMGDRLPAQSCLGMPGGKTVAIYEPFLKHNSKRIAYRFVRVETKTDDNSVAFGQEPDGDAGDELGANGDGDIR